MIDRNSFVVGVGVLAERFRSPLALPAQSGYYSILSSELTTEEFEIAIQLAFRYSKFWPSPQELIDYAKPPRDLGLEATRTFDTVRKLGVSHPTAGTSYSRVLVAELGVPALAGFDAIGANEGLKNLRVEYLAVARKDFVEAYVAAAREQQSVWQIQAVKQTLLAAPKELKA
jgi:hypothetical protein